MGVEPFLVVASLNTIVAQRLLRTICTKCKAEDPVAEEEAHRARVSTRAGERAIKMFKGKGCADLRQHGLQRPRRDLRGLDFSQTSRKWSCAARASIEIKKQAVKEGMKTLRMSALTQGGRRQHDTRRSALADHGELTYGQRSGLPALLKTMVDQDASDLHITVGVPPEFRIRGKMVKVKIDPLTRDRHQGALLFRAHGRAEGRVREEPRDRLLVRHQGSRPLPRKPFLPARQRGAAFSAGFRS